MDPAAAVLPSAMGTAAASAVGGTSAKLEGQQLLRVPVEYLRKTIRSNHRLLHAGHRDLLRSLDEAPSSATFGDADAIAHLSSLVSGLQGLKRKLEEGAREEELQVQRCRARIDHVAMPQSHWEASRLNRLLVDYMLRMSCFDAAASVVHAANIEDLVDVDVFQDAKFIIESLQNRETAPALAWCLENKARLKKSKSKLEFLLRLQEFIEMIKVHKYTQAIVYAKQNLHQWVSTHLTELQRVTVTLVYKSSTNCATYKDLFEQKQWDDLVNQFKLDFCQLYGMTLEPLLNIYLQAGLSALKTPFCQEGNCPARDPLSDEKFRKLAEPLPLTKHNHSKLVCFISKKLMDSENPPLVLPNGYVYSTKALEEMARSNGKITCPRTGAEYNFSELTKAYIS